MRAPAAAAEPAFSRRQALGTASFWLLLLYSRLMPWDHAAGALIHREAGGYSAQFDGLPYLPTRFGGGLICAPDEATWHLARAALLER